MRTYQALIFDLDGVLVDTAKHHFSAWQRLAQSFGISFNKEMNEQLKGISRVESLQMILSWGNIQLSPRDFDDAMKKKNSWYLEYIETMNPDEVLPGVRAFLEEAKKAGYKIGLGSASKNAQIILDKVLLTPYFDKIIDGNRTKKSKPDPEVFLLGSIDLAIPVEKCIVFEDAQAGVQAAKAGGMKAIGVGDPTILKEADLVIPGFANFSISDLNSIKD
jgi:beta-phosphoglucomutase